MATYNIEAPDLSNLLRAFEFLGQSNRIKAQREMEEKAQERAAKSGKFRAIGTVAGAVIGGYLTEGAGTVQGAAAGAAIGSTVGGMVGESQGGETVKSQEYVQTGLTAANLYGQAQQAERQDVYDKRAEEQYQYQQEQRGVQQREYEGSQMLAFQAGEEAKARIVGDQYTTEGYDYNKLTPQQQTKLNQIESIQSSGASPASQISRIQQISPPQPEIGTIERNGRTLLTVNGKPTVDLTAQKEKGLVTLIYPNTGDKATYRRSDPKLDKALEGGWVEATDYALVKQREASAKKSSEGGKETLFDLNKIKDAAKKDSDSRLKDKSGRLLVSPEEYQADVQRGFETRIETLIDSPGLPEKSSEELRAYLGDVRGKRAYSAAQSEFKTLERQIGTAPTVGIKSQARTLQNDVLNSDYLSDDQKKELNDNLYQLIKKSDTQTPPRGATRTEGTPTETPQQSGTPTDISLAEEPPTRKKFGNQELFDLLPKSPSEMLRERNRRRGLSSYNYR